MKNRSSNTVAVIMWVYAIVNAVVGIIFGCSMYDTYEGLSILFIAVTVVFSFGSYAVGEIIQLLQDIKDNTNGAIQPITLSQKQSSSVDDDLPLI